MRAITESGSCYEINEDGFLVKTDRDGVKVDSFRVYAMKAVPDEAATTADLHRLPNSEPEVGKRLYVVGYESWWISTPIVRIEY